MPAASGSPAFQGSGCYESGPLREVTGLAIRPGGLALTDRALDFCRFPAGARLLDVGCGAGATVEHLRSRHGFDASGVDLSRVLLAEGLGRNPALALAEGAAEALPFAAETRDGVLCECVLSLLQEPQVALAEFRRVLRPGGYLILSDLYSRDATTGIAAQGCGRGELTRGELAGLLSENGFATLMWEDHTHLLRELAARLILTSGSLEGLGCTTTRAGQRPGYYLLVARKA